VDDARKAFEETTKRGAKPFMQPREEQDEHGKVVRSGIHKYGDTVHVFVERKHYNGTLLPGYKVWNPPYRAEHVG
jgi:4-hydroxyphenylpyruvate dioxygenase